MTTKKKCPICESEDLQTITVEEHVAAPFGEAIPYSRVVDTCNVCGEEGDFLELMDDEYSRALMESSSRSVTSILDFLSNEGVSNVRFERAFSLPRRTVARWKEGKVSAAALGLLRLVRVKPELVAVAENHFCESIFPYKQTQESSSSIEVSSEEVPSVMLEVQEVTANA